MKEHIEEEIKNLKVQPSKDVAPLESGTITTQLAQAGLIDEYRIMMNPLVLGAGIPLFKGLGRRLDLQLVSARAFHNGNVLLHYRPAGKETYHGIQIIHRPSRRETRRPGPYYHPDL